MRTCARRWWASAREGGDEDEGSAFASVVDDAEMSEIIDEANEVRRAAKTKKKRDRQIYAHDTLNLAAAANPP